MLNPGNLFPTLDYEAAPGVREAIAKLGRTEDIRFSPGRNRLAFAGFGRDKIVVFEIGIERSAGAISISLSDHLVLTSNGLHYPHGVTFIDDETIIVANRRKFVTIYRLPPMGEACKEYELKPIRTLWRKSFRRLNSPGSVEVYKAADDELRVLVCDNYAHVITCAKLDPGKRYQVKDPRVLLRTGLEVPDGITISSNRKWIAVSNHGTGAVFIYENADDMNRKTEPVAILTDMDCPHGVRFADGDRTVIVADAARHYLYVFTSGRQGWSGEYSPRGCIQVLDEETFQKGRYSPEEGGPKGIDLDSRSRVLAVTCEHSPLSFYDLDAVMRSVS